MSLSSTSLRRTSGDGGESQQPFSEGGGAINNHSTNNRPIVHQSNKNAHQQQQEHTTSRTIASGSGPVPGHRHQEQAVILRSGIRMRTNSTDSVRGAFYTGPIQEQQQQHYHPVQHSSNNHAKNRKKKKTVTQTQILHQEPWHSLTGAPENQLRPPPVETVIVNEEDVVGPLRSFPPHNYGNNHYHFIPTNPNKGALEAITDDADLGDESMDGSTYFYGGASRSLNSRLRLQQQHRMSHSHVQDNGPHFVPPDLLYMSDTSTGSLAGSELVAGSHSADFSRFYNRITTTTTIPLPPPQAVLPPHSTAGPWPTPMGSHAYSAPLPPPPPPIADGQGASQTIDIFSNMVHADYGALTPADVDYDNNNGENRSRSTVYSDDNENKHDDDGKVEAKLCNTCMALFDPIDWLSTGVRFDDGGRASFDHSAAWTLAGFVRHCFYNPFAPEFTSLQQFNWAVILGLVMGFYTAVWKGIIEAGVEFVWRTIPEFLLSAGVFTQLDGAFPLYHYMWMCPAVLSGVLSYTFVALPMRIPDQNDWINSVHSRGVIDHRTFLTLFILSTVGMTSGLSLGPELPLVLTAGMVGSWLGLVTQQSMLQARVMNLTAASAAIGGFFGFPMAGALFVLELPHRMGLQYFEALSPATIASIVAVLANRLITGNEVTGYYSYPFLTLTLPSQVFSSAVVYGFFGAAIGIWYALCVLKVKNWVHDWLHAPAQHHHGGEEPGGGDDVMAAKHSQPLADEHSSDEDGIHKKNDENIPLVKAQAIKQQHSSQAQAPRATPRNTLCNLFCCVIPQAKYRAAVAGSIAGALCGVVGMFVPHTMFWGEAQLQNLIDKGRTPLPVFGQEGEVTSDLVALGYCMIDPSDPAAVSAGFSISCSALISVSKVVVIGLSLGTGIIGGHFWGPLFVGCAASHLFSDLVQKFSETFGFGSSLVAHPCVVILCTMASAHVVTFRAHMGIMLILTLTISAFSPEDNVNGNSMVAGDYSAVFPLLVVSVFVALMVSRQTVFYKTQRSRGDIMAVPEVLCEPGMEGAPLVVDFDAESDRDSFYAASESDHSDDGDGHSHHRNSDNPGDARSLSSTSQRGVRTIEETITQNDIENAFATHAATVKVQECPIWRTGPGEHVQTHGQSVREAFSGDSTIGHGPLLDLSSSRLDELLSQPMEPYQPQHSPAGMHRRSKSAPDHQPDIVPPSPTTDSLRSKREQRENFRFDPSQQERINSGSQRGLLVRVNSYGELQKHQPSLMDQARMRGASTSAHRRVPSLPSGRHSRKNSESSVNGALVAAQDDSNSPGSRSHSHSSSPTTESARKATGVGYGGGALSLDDIERSFNRVINAQVEPLSSGRSPWTSNKVSKRAII